jgi:hypothetical protein
MVVTSDHKQDDNTKPLDQILNLSQQKHRLLKELKKMSDYWNERRDKFKSVEPPEIPKRSGKRKRKNTKRWCKGVEGREHELKIAKKRSWVCGEMSWRSAWYCWHIRICKNCYKVLEYNLKDCPSLPEVGGC